MKIYEREGMNKRRKDDAEEEEKNISFPHLVMHQYVHDVVVYFRGDTPPRFVGQQHVLNPQQRHQDEGGSHCLHVETGLGLMSHLQLGDQHSHNVEQKKQVDLRGYSGGGGHFKIRTYCSSTTGLFY